MNLIKFIKENFHPKDRPKWRDEKVLLNMFSFPATLLILSFFIHSDRAYSLPLMCLFASVANLVGYLTGHDAGRETEKLFPGYKPFWNKP